MLNKRNPQLNKHGELLHLLSIEGLPKAVLTPHIAGSMGNEVARMGLLAVDEVERFMAGEPLIYDVRAEDLDLLA